MSKTIEFIEKEIESTQNWLEYLDFIKNDEDIENDVDFENFTNFYNENKEKLKTLQQIKEELEAWEIMQSKLELKLQRSTFDCDNFNKVIHSYVYNYITLNEQENKTINKAMGG